MRWPRIQSFEFNEHPGVPAPIRDTITESLSNALVWNHTFHELIPAFSRFVSHARVREVLDLGSGAGAPIRYIHQQLTQHDTSPPAFVLSDLHPNVPRWGALTADLDGAITFIPEPVDATRVPREHTLNRARSMFNVFHHFDPEQAQAILADAIAHKSPIFIGEAMTRHPKNFVNMWPLGTLALLSNPALSPTNRLQKAAITWASPVAILTGLWDGFISSLRIYDERDLRDMVARIPGGRTYHWTYGEFSHWPRGTGSYFYGVPH